MAKVFLTELTTEELTALLNKHEPFAVKFGSQFGKITLEPKEARALIRWIEHYKRMRRENNDF